MKILAVMTDLFFGVKISDAAKRYGLSMEFLKDRETVLAKLAENPALVIFDLNCTALDPVAVITEMRQNPATQHIPTLGFLSHVQTDLRQRVIDAGCETVLARSAFAQNLPAILELYASADTSSRN